MRFRRNQFIDVLVNGSAYVGNLEDGASIVGTDCDVQEDPWVIPWLLGATNATGYVAVKPGGPSVTVGKETSVLSISADVNVAGYDVALELSMLVCEASRAPVMNDMTVGLFSAVAAWQAIAYSLASLENEDGADEDDNEKDHANSDEGNQLPDIVSPAVQQRCAHILDSHADVIRGLLIADLPMLGSVALAHAHFPMRSRARLHAQERRRRDEEEKKNEERRRAMLATEALGNVCSENTEGIASSANNTPMLARRRMRARGVCFTDSDASSEGGGAGDPTTKALRGSTAEEAPTKAARSCSPESDVQEPVSKRRRIVSVKEPDAIDISDRLASGTGGSAAPVATLEKVEDSHDFAGKNLELKSDAEAPKKAQGIQSPTFEPEPAQMPSSTSPTNSQPRASKRKDKKKKKKRVSLF